MSYAAARVAFRGASAATGRAGVREGAVAARHTISITAASGNRRSGWRRYLLDQARHARECQGRMTRVFPGLAVPANVLSQPRKIADVDVAKDDAIAHIRATARRRSARPTARAQHETQPPPGCARRRRALTAPPPAAGAAAERRSAAPRRCSPRDRPSGRLRSSGMSGRPCPWERPPRTRPAGSFILLLLLFIIIFRF